MPFEQTLAAVPADGKPTNGGAETRQARDVGYFVNTNLDRLNRFIERELQYRIDNGQLTSNLVSREEVLDETIATALSEDEHRPESLSIERWLYALALRSISTVVRRNSDESETVHLELPAGLQNVTGSDELWLQFHQPDDWLNEEAIIPDRNHTSPETAAASDEFIAQVETALKGAKPEEREAFVLLAIEGFTLDEIAQVSGRSVDDVKKSIEQARKRVEQRLPPGNALKAELLKHTRIA